MYNNEKLWIPTLDGKNIRVFPALKCQIFVAHIQRHLKRREEGLFFKGGRQIPRNKVGCKICEKSIDQIWKEESPKLKRERNEKP